MVFASVSFSSPLPVAVARTSQSPFPLSVIVSKMTSEYNIKEFKEKLIELTKEGYPMIKGNPFAIFSVNLSDKPFYGNIYESSFRITKNTNINPLPYLIVGKFKKNGEKTQINYELISMKFGYYWIKFFPILINIIGIIALTINWKSINTNNILNVKFIFFILFAELIVIIPLLLTEIRKKRFEKKFKELLKVKQLQIT